MILGLDVTLWLYVTLAGLFRLLWGVSQPLALGVLSLAGFGILAIGNPIAALYCSAQVALVLLLYVLGRLFPKSAVRISWFAFFGLVPANLQLWFGDQPFFAALHGSAEAGTLSLISWTAGSAFFVIRSFVGLREARQEGRLRLLSLLAGLSFLPAFPAGPIFGTQPFRPERIAARIEARSIALAVMKLGWGIAAFYAIAPALRALAAGNGISSLASVADVYLGFAALFFDFSGYTLMAIAMAAFFGITLPENFNRPYLAISIQDFWRRWHMSLNNFVGTYLFKPYVRLTGAPRRGIFLAFVAVGMWHEFSVGYLLWGIGHGAALSLAMKPPKQWSGLMARLPPWLSAGFGWFLTMTVVAVLSRIAVGHL